MDNWSQEYNRRSAIRALLQKEMGGTDLVWQQALTLLRFPIVSQPEGGWSVWLSPDQTDTVLVDACYKCADCPETFCAHAATAMWHDRLQEKPMPSETPKAHFTDDDIMYYKGKPFIFYDALLREGKALGLVSLDATWTYNDAGLSLAIAVAVFADGRRHTECGDATPQNVGEYVVPHFRRMSLTRAKARALRDALGVKECSIEEIGDEEKAPTQPRDVPQKTTKAPASSQPASTFENQQVPFEASEIQEETYQGKTRYKVFGEHMPAKYKQYGIILTAYAANISGLDIKNLPDIHGWEVQWSLSEYNGKMYPRVDRLVDPGAHAADDADTDVPF